MPGSFSGSVVRGKVTYIFYNGTTENEEDVIKIMKVTEKAAPTETLKVDGVNVPASQGPIAATIVGDSNWIRLYVVNKKTIVEYGLDTEVGKDDEWKKEGFTSNIKLNQHSFLTVMGKPELGNTVNAKGNQVRLRLFYSKEGAANQITTQTYTDLEGWQEKTIDS